MGRQRKNAKHLPRYVYQRRGAYYFQNPETRQWEPLGRDLAQALAQYANRVNVPEKLDTVADVIARYRREVLTGKRPTTQKNEGAQLDRLERVFGGMRPSTLTAQDVYKYADARRSVPVAARHEVALLRHVMAKALRWGVIAANPVAAVELDKPPAKPKRYVSDDEFYAVWEVAPPPIRCAMTLALLTGLRRGDILALTRDNLTDDGLLVQTSKTDAGLLFEWTPELRQAVEDCKRLRPQLPGHYLVRTGKGRPYSAAGFSAIWKRAVARAGQAYTFHDLRRKSASDAPTLAEAQARLGHTSEAVTKRFYMAKPARVSPLKSKNSGRGNE